MFTKFTTYLGNKSVQFFSCIGNYFYFTYQTIISLKNLQLSHLLNNMIHIGISSLPIVAITLIFIGMVFTTQLTTEFSKMGANKMIGGIIGFAIWRELGPLFTGVVVAARVGAAISTEIAAMKVYGQLNALKGMAINPLSYLYLPKIIATILMLPLLVIFADFVGFIAGLIVYSVFFHGNSTQYIFSASQMLSNIDITGGILIKAPIFGFIIASFATFIGAHTKNGSAGIGRSATITVVSVLIALFITNFFLSLLIF